MCPIFDYNCNCGQVRKDELVKDSNELVLCVCGEPMEKIYNYAPKMFDPNKVYSTNKDSDVDQIFNDSIF